MKCVQYYNNNNKSTSNNNQQINMLFKSHENILQVHKFWYILPKKLLQFAANIYFFKVMLKRERFHIYFLIYR